MFSRAGDTPARIGYEGTFLPTRIDKPNIELSVYLTGFYNGGAKLRLLNWSAQYVALLIKY